MSYKITIVCFTLFFDKIVQSCRASEGVIARQCGSLVVEYTKSYFVCFTVIYY